MVDHTHSVTEWVGSVCVCVCVYVCVCVCVCVCVLLDLFQGDLRCVSSPHQVHHQWWCPEDSPTLKLTNLLFANPVCNQSWSWGDLLVAHVGFIRECYSITCVLNSTSEHTCLERDYLTCSSIVLIVYSRSPADCRGGDLVLFCHDEMAGFCSVIFQSKLISSYVISRTKSTLVQSIQSILRRSGR